MAKVRSSQAMPAARWVIALLLCLLSCTRSPSAPDASAPTPVPVPAIDLDARYRGKPMLAVIEGYALAAIGQLPNTQEVLIAAKVVHAFGGGDDWRATVRKTMNWPANIDERIQSEWRQFSQKATQAGSAADAKAFARTFADQYAK